MSDFISWNSAQLDTPRKSGQQGIVDDTVDISTERITREEESSGLNESGQYDADSTGDAENDYVSEYRDSRELPMQHSGARSDDSDDVDVLPPRRHGTSASQNAATHGNVIASSHGKPSGSQNSHKKAQADKKTAKKTKADADKPQTGTAQIRDFPRSLLSLARAEFPDAGNNTDALAAYVLAKSGRTNIDVPESVAALVKDWDGDKTLENMERRISALTNQTAVLLGLLQEIELLTTFIAFDRLGYRQEMASDIRNVDFLENGVTDLLARLREQSKTLRKQEAIKNGRPIR